MAWGEGIGEEGGAVMGAFIIMLFVAPILATCAEGFEKHPEYRAGMALVILFFFVIGWLLYLTIAACHNADDNKLNNKE